MVSRIWWYSDSGMVSEYCGTGIVEWFQEYGVTVIVECFQEYGGAVIMGWFQNFVWYRDSGYGFKNMVVQ